MHSGNPGLPQSPSDSLEQAAQVTTAQVRSLFDMNLGERGRLVGESIPQNQRPLLEAMGMCGDCELRVCHNSGSCILEVDGQRVGLSEEIASSLRVLPLDS